jgi:hypothetical protein
MPMAGAGAQRGLRALAAAKPRLPYEHSWHDFAVFMLHVAAEIEHSLMVQYLYAAYSIGGAGLGEAAHEPARQWREIILGIAKEEMGHLITVQNILRLIGGPLHLEREDYPFRSEFYPFHFTLEPATKSSIAKYVIAEAPLAFLDTAEGKEIVARARKADDGRAVLPVGVLYEELIELFGNEGALTDDDFRADTEPYQASWDEWGRGYGLGQRGNVAQSAPKKTPDLLILKTTDRASAVDALKSIARQGEAPALGRGGSADEKSHFARFLEIYRVFPERNPPSRNIPANPSTEQPQDGDDGDRSGPLGCASITDERSLLWAHLFNIRYRKLLFSLKHVFHVEAGDSVDTPTARGNLIAWTFGEMYNLRAIAGILVTLPLKSDGGSRRAAPPFEVPYTLALPDWDSDKWRVHRDLIGASEKVIHQLETKDEERRDYLRALRDHDKLDLEVVERLLDVLQAREANA